MDELTPKQREVFKFLKAYAKANGMPPTRSEIAAGFGWKSLNAAQQHLVLIARKGYIRLSEGSKSRGIAFLK